MYTLTGCQMLFWMFICMFLWHGFRIKQSGTTSLVDKQKIKI